MFISNLCLYLGFYACAFIFIYIYINALMYECKKASTQYILTMQCKYIYIYFFIHHQCIRIYINIYI